MRTDVRFALVMVTLPSAPEVDPCPDVLLAGKDVAEMLRLSNRLCKLHQEDLRLISKILMCTGPVSLASLRDDLTRNAAERQTAQEQLRMLVVSGEKMEPVSDEDYDSDDSAAIRCQLKMTLKLSKTPIQWIEESKQKSDGAIETISPFTKSITGPGNRRRFTASVIVNGSYFVSCGSHSTYIAAKQNVASIAAHYFFVV